MNLSVSTWNYLCAFGDDVDLEVAAGQIQEEGFGVEFWTDWPPQPEAFARDNWMRLGRLVAGARSSMHTALNAWDADGLMTEIEMVQSVGSSVLVVHTSTLGLDSSVDSERLAMCGNAVRHAQSKGVIVALENGTIEALTTAVEAIDELGICIDIGHANIAPEPVAQFFDTFKSRLVHVHLGDNFGTGDDHLAPGAGKIATEDWEKLFATLEEIDYGGDLVLEINSKFPKRSARFARKFLESFSS